MVHQEKSLKAIIINGNLGAGKTETGTLLAEMLDFSFLSSGNFFREEAASRGLSFTELHEIMKTDTSIDHMLDERLKAFLNTNDSFILDSRMAAFFQPRAFKVFLSVDPLVGATRIFENIANNPARKAEAGASSVEEIMKNNEHRLESERLRYQALYNFDHIDQSLYDLVVDTSTISSKETADLIFTEYERWKKAPMV